MCLMRRLSPIIALLVAGGLFALWTARGTTQTPQPAAAPDQGRGTGRVPTASYAVPRVPDGVKPGQTWIPDLPSMDSLLPPPGWRPSNVEVPWMPATLLRLPRKNVIRAKYPVIDFHLHAGNTTPALINLMDRIGMGA